MHILAVGPGRPLADYSMCGGGAALAVRPSLVNHASHFCFDKDTDTKRAWPGKLAETAEKAPQNLAKAVQSKQWAVRDKVGAHLSIPKYYVEAEQRVEEEEKKRKKQQHQQKYTEVQPDG
ncbi:hypothetical protein M5D96_002770 [Drosophila gunungcola]|uniref:Uncharacterized protein n=1 Tax=Drosophila gunungcola TaxID=103775 RepID=A0A9P9Z1I2_9MUSC|nr:hypothetical protein M5D96_002770 [Drosophila gunungcola]